MLIRLLSASGSPPGTLAMMGVLRECPTGTRREQAACQMLGKAGPPQQASAAAVREVRAVSRRQESRGASFTCKIGSVLLLIFHDMLLKITARYDFYEHDDR